MADYEQHPSGLLLPANFAERPTRRAGPELREIATTSDGRDITRGYLDPLMLQPSTDSILQGRGGGDYRVYRQVLHDEQVKSCFGQRQLAVISKEWAVEPGGKSARDKAAAVHLEEQLHAISWDDATSKMLFGVFYGFAVAEAMWARDGRHVVLDTIKVRDRQRFGFDGAGRLRMKTMSQPEGELLPERKFWAFQTGTDHDDAPHGLALAHWLYWPVFFKRNGLKYWLVFLEKFGQPTAMGKYQEGEDPKNRARLLAALAAISTDAGIIVPHGMEIELLEAARSGTADYVQLYDRMDRAIAKVCLGQVASTEGTPGRLGNDQLQSNVRDDLVKADADLVCESFNRSIARWLTEWNHPGARAPRVYRKCEPDEDQNSKAERDTKIYSMGFKPTLKHIQDNYDGDWEVRTEQPPLANPPALPAAAFAADPAQAPTDPADPPEAMSPQLERQMQPVLRDWAEQLRAIIDEAGSLDAIREQLLALAPQLSLDEYVALLGEALTTASLAGRNDVEDEIR